MCAMRFLGPPAVDAAAQAPLDVLMVVDVSKSMEWTEKVVKAAEGLVARLEVEDRLAFYVFAGSICEEMPLAPGPHSRHAERVGAVLRAFRPRATPAVLPEKSETSSTKSTKVAELPPTCAGGVGSRDQSAILEAFRHGVFTSGVQHALRQGNVDDRKRLVLLVSDGFDDPSGSYVPGPAKAAALSTVDRLRKDFDIVKDSEKYEQARQTLDQLMRVRLNDGRPMARYFEVVLFWDWSHRLMGPLFDEPGDSELAARHVRRFWNAVLTEPRFGQFLNDEPSLQERRIYPRKRDNQVGFAAATPSPESSIEEIDHDVYRVLRDKPREVIATVTCPSCKLAKPQGGAISLPPLPLEVEFKSTYERKIMLSGKELFIEGRAADGQPAELKNSPPLLATSISPIAETGKHAEGDGALRVRLGFWATDGGLGAIRYSRIRVASRHREKEKLAVAQDGQSNVYRFVSPEATIEDGGVHYDTTSHRFLRFSVSPEAMLRLQFTRGINGRDIEPAPTKPRIDDRPDAPSNVGHDAFSKASDRAICQRGSEAIFALCRFVFNPKFSIIAFRPTVEAKEGRLTLQPLDTLNETVLIVVNRGWLILAAMVYVALIGLRARVYRWLPPAFLSRLRTTGIQRDKLVIFLELGGFFLYLFGLNFPLDLFPSAHHGATDHGTTSSNPSASNEWTALEFLLGQSSLMIVGLVPCFAVVSILFAVLRSRREANKQGAHKTATEAAQANKQESDKAAAEEKETARHGAGEVVAEGTEAFTTAWLAFWTLVGLSRHLAKSAVPGVVGVALVLFVSQTANGKSLTNTLLDAAAAACLVYIVLDTFGLWSTW